MVHAGKVNCTVCQYNYFSSAQITSGAVYNTQTHASKAGKPQAEPGAAPGPPRLRAGRLGAALAPRPLVPSLQCELGEPGPPTARSEKIPRFRTRKKVKSQESENGIMNTDHLLIAMRNK